MFKRYLDLHFTRVLVITGIATMLPVLQYAAPTLFLAAGKMHVDDNAGLFFARHWGLLVFCLGALLVYAARHPELRRPVVFAAAVEKLGLVLTLAMSWSDPALAGLHGAALFDGLCVLLYGAFLWQKAPQPA